MIDYNLRQLKLMTKTLDNFENKTITIDVLVSNLDGLQNSLQSMDANWKEKFLQQWGLLEDVYASALDKELGEIPDDHLILVNVAIKKIRKLINECATF